MGPSDFAPAGGHGPHAGALRTGVVGTGLREMAAIAARYDTVMSWAMLRALLEAGVSVRLPAKRRHAHDHARALEVTERELAWCMANRSSPMDLLR